MQQAERDPKLTLEEVRILGSKLMDLHGALASQPEQQKLFEEAVELGIGGKFTDKGLTATYLDRNVMPRFSRVQAMVYLMDRHVDQWCSDQEKQIDASGLQPEQKDAKGSDLLAFAEKIHNGLIEAEEAIGVASHQRVCAACGVGA